jgi:hypothetical protein
MPRRIEVTATGVDETAQQLERLNKALAETTDQAQHAHKALDVFGRSGAQGGPSNTGLLAQIASDAKAGMSAVGEAIGNAVEHLALFSRAEQELAAHTKASAAEQRAEAEQQTQAYLAEVAKRTAIRAVEETAEALAAVASYRFDSAAEHAASAAVFAGISGAAAGAGYAIGSTRGNTPQEDQQLARANGGGSGGSGDSALVVIQFNAGGLFMTPADVSRGVQAAQLQAQRLG